MCLVTADSSVSAKPRWLAGFGTDGAQSFWDEFDATGRLSAESVFSLDTVPGALLDASGDRLTDEELEDRLPRMRTGSLAITHTIPPGSHRDFEFVLGWSFPWRIRGWGGQILATPADAGTVRNDYATRFDDAWHVARSLVDQHERLEAATLAFHRSLHGSSLDDAIVDAAAAGIACLRSTTCLLLEGERFAAWEGSFAHAGSCEGTCTHVWNYAQTAAHLFPSLERDARRTEFLGETDDEGLMQFRSQTVFDLPRWSMVPAIDGQCGTIVRAYREWRFSGDDAFLRELWPAIVRAMDFSLTHWGADQDGLPDRLAHTTFDIELSQPEPLGCILLLAALTACGRMASALDDHSGAERYSELAASIAGAIDRRLFNGEWYEQPAGAGGEIRHQYGHGVLSDQLFGQLLARATGLGALLPEEHVRSALRAVHRYNFGTVDAAGAHVQRAIAVPGETGLRVASWPDGGRPRYPLIYGDEVWSGTEYEVAAHLIYEGLVTEGLEIVRAVRARHAGHNRSPWDEAECGGHYARSMSSWAVLLAATGADWDGTTGTLSISPPLPGDLATFFSTGAAWGSLELSDERIVVRVEGGELALRGLLVHGRECLASPATARTGESITAAIGRTTP
jgi:uncharacterized protein (DUF608 family)